MVVFEFIWLTLTSLISCENVSKNSNSTDSSESAIFLIQILLMIVWRLTTFEWQFTMQLIVTSPTDAAFRQWHKRFESHEVHKRNYLNINNGKFNSIYQFQWFSNNNHSQDSPKNVFIPNSMAFRFKISLFAKNFVYLHFVSNLLFYAVVYCHQHILECMK